MDLGIELTVHWVVYSMHTTYTQIVLTLSDHGLRAIAMANQ